MLRRLFVGREMPDLITALVTPRKKGGYEVQLIAETGREIPKQPGPTASLTETRTIVDPLITNYYMQDELFAELLLTQLLGVGYTMYPWDAGGRKVSKELAERIGTDFFVFEVEETQDGFVAAAMDVEVVAGDLDALAQRAEQALTLRWNELANSPIPGMLNWQRTFTASGFTPFRRERRADASP
jgi:hypothetical protein